MYLKHDNGIVTFVMIAGKDKVKSTMTLSQARRVIVQGENVEETPTEIIIDNKYFFPLAKTKSRKKKEVADDV